MSGLDWLSAKCALKRPLLGGALLALVTTAGSQALASAGCDAVNAGAFNVHFTQPNSPSMNITGFAIGDKITFNLTGAEPSGGANAFVVAEPNNTVLLNVRDIMSPRSFSIPVSAVTGTLCKLCHKPRARRRSALRRLAPRRAPAALAIPTAAAACCASHKDSRSEFGCGDLGRHRRDQRCFHLSWRHADRNCRRRLAADRTEANRPPRSAPREAIHA